MISEKQKQAVRLLYLDGMKVQDVAATLGVTRCTIWRWKKTRAFKQEWQKVRNASIRQWKKDMGFTDPNKAWRQELHRLQQKAEQEAAKIHDGNTKAFDAAWAAYSKHLMAGISNMKKRLRIR